MFNYALFLDTAYVFARINPRDQWHARAAELQTRITGENRFLVVTEFGLTEIADGLSAVKFRQEAAKIIHNLQTSVFVEVVPATSEL